MSELGCEGQGQRWEFIKENKKGKKKERKRALDQESDQQYVQEKESYQI